MQSTKGFTLSEIMMSLAIVSIGILSLMTLALFGFNEFQYTKNRLEAQTEAGRFQYLVSSYLAQAVKVGIGNPGVPGNTGGILTLNLNEIADAGAGPAGDLLLMANFMRDVGGRGDTPNLVEGNYLESAIWWRRPTLATSGVVFFAEGAPGANLTPNYSQQFVSRLTELELASENTTGATAAVRVRAVFRYFRPSTGSNWCPRTDITNGAAGCAATPGLVYTDFERSFRVSLRNNILQTSLVNGLPERPLGLVYFFNQTVPASWRF